MLNATYDIFFTGRKLHSIGGAYKQATVQNRKHERSCGLVLGVSHPKGGRKINVSIPWEKTNNGKHSFVHIRLYIKYQKTNTQELHFRGFVVTLNSQNS